MLPAVEPKITNLAAFRSAIQRAISEAPHELAEGLRMVGEPLRQEASARAPRLTGTLAGSFGVQVHGDTGEITSGAPYGAGAEWGVRGKWGGFQRYGKPGSRFAGKALETQKEAAAKILDEKLEDIIEIHGWAT